MIYNDICELSHSANVKYALFVAVNLQQDYQEGLGKRVKTVYSKLRCEWTVVDFSSTNNVKHRKVANSTYYSYQHAIFASLLWFQSFNFCCGSIIVSPPTSNFYIFSSL